MNRLAAAAALVLALLPAVLPGARAAEGTPPKVEDVLRRFDDLYRSKSSIARLRMTTVSGGRERVLEMRAWTRGEDEALIVIESPEREKGTATLKVGKNLWNYFPRISRTMRIPPSMMLGSWMGSDFTNDDLVREHSYLDDYASRLDGRSESPAGWRIVSEARPGVVGLWQRLVWVVSDDDLLPVQAEFYDRKGRLARILTYGEVRELGGRRVPTKLELVPQDEKGKRTILEYSEIAFDANVPDDTFSLSRLERAR